MRGIIIIFLFFGNSLFGQLGQVTKESYFPVKIDKKWGMINTKGKIIIKPVYDAIGEFRDFGYAVMQRNNGIGLLNQFGQEIITPKYDDIKILDSLIFAVLDSDDWKVVNLKEEIILKNGYDQVQILEGKFIGFQKDRKWGVADISGKIISVARFDAIELLENNFFLTTINGKHGVIASDGQQILPNDSDEIQKYNKDLFFFQKNKKWGAVNPKGEMLIRPSFQSFLTLSDNFIKLIANNRVFLYSIPKEKIITKGQYDGYYSFSNKYILCKKNQKLGLIDWLGRELLKVKYNEIQVFTKDQFRVNLQGNWGVVNTSDQVIVPFEYEYITPLKSSICVVKKQGKLGVVSRNGQQQVESKYDKIQIENNKAKAFEKGILTVLNFDGNGKIQGEDQFENHLTLKIGKKKKQYISENGDDPNNYQLNDFEWYYDALQDKWGLRKLEDGSTHIEPVFDWIKMEKDINFTLVGIEKWNKYSFDRTTYRFDMVFGLVDNRNGLLVTPVELLDIRISDFKDGYPSARIVFENGTHGLVAGNGAYIVRDFAFIDAFEDGIARMSMKGQLSGNLKNKDRGLGKVKNYLRSLLSPNYMTDYTQHDQEFRRDADMTCKNCDWGYIDTAGQIVVSPQFSFVEQMKKQVGIVEKNKKIGAVKANGNILLQCEYDQVRFLKNTNNQILQVYKSASKYGLIDTLAKVAVDLKYDEIGALSEERLAVAENGLWGFTNKEGKEIIPCRYRKVSKFQEGYAAVQLGNKWGFIDANGKIIIEFKYRRVGNFSNGLAWVATGSGVGFINSSGDKVIPPKYDRAYDFENKVARVIVDGEYGLINELGEYFLRPKYNNIEPFNENGVAIVQIGRERIRYGILSATGDLLTDKKYKKIEPFKEGFAVVQLKNKFGYIDRLGQLVIDCNYSKASSFSEGLAAVQKNGQCGYIDRRGKEVIPLIYSRCLDFEEGKAIVYRGMPKAGVIDRSGHEIIAPSIKGLVGFSNKRGLIRDGNFNYYYITEEAKFHEGYYDYAQAFHHGIAIVQKAGKWGIINQNGMPIISPKYDKIEPFEKGYAKVKINGFSGLTNLEGEMIVKPDYEYISYAGNGLYRVEQGDKVGYFNSTGEWIWSLNN